MIEGERGCTFGSEHDVVFLEVDIRYDGVEGEYDRIGGRN